MKKDNAVMEKTPEELAKIATTVRREIVKMIYAAGSGHPAGSLGMAEIFVALYFGILNHDPKKPSWELRDRFFLSNGHICPALYATLALAGYFSSDKLKTLRQLGSPLQGHPEKGRLPGIESSSGPLGEGFAQACGYALAARMDSARFRVYCITSDGEHDEGNHWEAVAFASKYCLANLTLIVDRNQIQSDGRTENVMPLEPLADKYRAFGFNVININGHDFEQILSAADAARREYQKPSVIIANVVAGKGVSFMEGNYRWHAKPIDKQQCEDALKELK